MFCVPSNNKPHRRESALEAWARINKARLDFQYKTSEHNDPTHLILGGSVSEEIRYLVFPDYHFSMDGMIIMNMEVHVSKKYPDVIAVC